MLTLGEIDFLYTDTVKVTGIAPAEDNARELYVGYLADVNAGDHTGKCSKPVLQGGEQ